MFELTNNEKETLEDLKEELSNEDVINKIVTANYLLHEIENKFGIDILNFSIGYLSGSLQYHNSYDNQELSVMEKAGEMMRDGYGEFHGEVGDLMAGICSNHSIDLHSNVAKRLAGSIDKLAESKKVKWIDNYNKSVELGLIKKEG